MSRQKRVLIGTLAAIVLAVLLVVLLFALSRLEYRLDAVPEGAGLALTREEAEEQAAIYYNGEKYVKKPRLSTLLILGIDDAEVTDYESYRNPSQADFIMLAVFNPKKKQCILLQIDRDTMSAVPVLDAFGDAMGMETMQLALAHTYGDGKEQSCENTEAAVSYFLYGLEIDNYFALTMDAIPIMNDLVGGVTVTVEDDFTGVDDTLVQGETVTLTADNVEHFVRARSGMAEDKTNVNRMARQRTYIKGLIESLQSATYQDPEFVAHAYEALEGSLVSDCTMFDLSAYADRFSHYSLGGIYVPKGESVRGEKFMEFYADENELQALMLELFYDPVEN